VALAVADARAAPYERARILLALADLRVATGDADAARDVLAAARAICARLRARPALTRADLLAARIETAPHAPSPAGLSAREVEVLRLLAAGRTNQAIADALCISERTVNKHVTRILAKTDSDNRTAAAAFAHRHGLA
jgi:DNA-binding NarL/FixJ family response regulator